MVGIYFSGVNFGNEKGHVRYLALASPTANAFFPYLYLEI